MSGCGGGGGATTPAAPPPVGTPPPPPPPVSNAPATGLLRDTFRNNFQVGTAITNANAQSSSASADLAVDQFGMITPEYELKLNNIAPNEGSLDFAEADDLVDWAIGNNMTVRGHALVWHAATPDYFLQGSPADIRLRLEDYIAAVMDHFRGRITIWDVANEVVSVDLYRGDEGIGPDRRSNWFEAVGNADYLDWAFRAARAADPTAQLFLSEYETENAFKRRWVIEILQRFADRGVPIDGVGHQFHLNLDTDPALALAAIDDVDNQFMGLVNHITELDLSFYRDPGTCWESETNCIADIGPTAPDGMLATQAQILRDLFTGFVQRSSVDVVNFWGVKDDDSWLNDVPVERYNYPLLFDRGGDPKPAFLAITDPSYVI